MTRKVWKPLYVSEFWRMCGDQATANKKWRKINLIYELDKTPLKKMYSRLRSKYFPFYLFLFPAVLRSLVIYLLDSFTVLSPPLLLLIICLYSWPFILIFRNSHVELFVKREGNFISSPDINLIHLTRYSLW